MLSAAHNDDKVALVHLSKMFQQSIAKEILLEMVRGQNRTKWINQWQAQQQKKMFQYEKENHLKYLPFLPRIDPTKSNVFIFFVSTVRWLAVRTCISLLSVKGSSSQFSRQVTSYTDILNMLCFTLSIKYSNRISSMSLTQWWYSREIRKRYFCSYHT